MKMWTRKNKCDWISVLDYYRALKKYQYTVFIVQENIEKFNIIYSTPPPKKRKRKKIKEKKWESHYLKNNSTM